MTHKQDRKMSKNGLVPTSQPNPEVTTKAKRRTFTAGYHYGFSRNGRYWGNSLFPNKCRFDDLRDFQ